MKNLKFVVASLILVAGGIFASSFATKSFNKNAFAVVCYYFNPPTTTFKDVVGIDRNLNQTQVTTTGNWTLIVPGVPPPADCLDGQYLCAICFDTSEYTLQQAIDLVWSRYTAIPGLPHATDIDPGTKTLTVFRQGAVDNHD